MLEDVEELMPARPATLRNPGTPDQIVMIQHSLTHFPKQPWCKMCVESRGHDSPHREQLKIDAVVSQSQFDYGYSGGGSPVQLACFLVGTDTSSGAIHSTMVPDSKKIHIPYVVATTAKWVRVPRCIRNKEAEKVKQMKENDSSSVSRKESAFNIRTAEERMENSSSSTGGNLTSTNIESQDVMFIVLQKNTRSMNSISSL